MNVKGENVWGLCIGWTCRSTWGQLIAKACRQMKVCRPRIFKKGRGRDSRKTCPLIPLTKRSGVITLMGTALKRQHPGLSVEVSWPSDDHRPVGAGSVLQRWGVYLRANPRGAAGPPGAGRASGGGVRPRALEESGARASRGRPAEPGTGGGCERAARAHSARLTRRWDTCGSWEPGASGGCSCAPQTPAQVTYPGRQGGEQKSVQTQPLLPEPRERRDWLPGTSPAPRVRVRLHGDPGDLSGTRDLQGRRNRQTEEKRDCS